MDRYGAAKARMIMRTIHPMHSQKPHPRRRLTASSVTATSPDVSTTSVRVSVSLIVSLSGR